MKRIILGVCFICAICTIGISPAQAGFWGSLFSCFDDSGFEKSGSGAKVTVETCGVEQSLDMSQTKTYSTTKKNYDKTVSETKEKIQSGDHSAMVNSSEGPTKTVTTTAGYSVKAGKLEVRSKSKSKNTISAAEQALKDAELNKMKQGVTLSTSCDYIAAGRQVYCLETEPLIEQ